MATNNANTPEGSSEDESFNPENQQLTPGIGVDPSAITPEAHQMAVQLANNMIGDTQTQDSINPESSPIDLIAAPVGAGLAGEEAVAGNEIGALNTSGRPDFSYLLKKTKAAPEFGKVIVKEAPEQALGVTANDIKQAGAKNLGVVANDIKQAGNPNYGKVIWKPYADGGDVGSSTPPQGAEPPDSIPVSEFESDEDHYGSPIEQAKTFLEGASQGVAGPLADLAETNTGVDPQDIRLRAENNPGMHTMGNIAGLAGSMASGMGEGALVAHAGEAMASHLIPEAVSASAKIGKAGLQAATELGLLQSSDETSKMIQQDPDQSVGTALANVGLASAMGLVGGAALGGVSPLWEATVGHKAGQLAEDFRGQIHERLTNPDPVASVTDELSQHYNNIKGLADEVYGPTGLKAQDIAKNLPPLNDAMLDQSTKVAQNLSDQVAKMVKKDYDYSPRLTQKLQADLDNYTTAISKDNLTSSDVFNATQDLKQQLQSYAKFDKFVKPTDDAYQFVKDAKGLAANLRESLEDPKIWGKAAERQTAINGAFKDFLPSLKDFEKKFTVEVAGERTIDPGKVATYVNQAGKASAETKKAMLQNFIDASAKYAKVIGDTHANLGMENPLQPYSLTAVNKTFEKMTPGAKLANAFIDQGLHGGGAHGIGAGIGAAAGHGLGSPLIGAVVGERVLGPFMEKVLPSLARPFLEKAANARGVKSAIDYGMNVAQGDTLISKATKNIFKPGAEVLSESMMPKDRDLDKLDQAFSKSRLTPDALINDSQDKALGHYLPEHDKALDMTKGQVAAYINSVRPNLDRQSPLDSKNVPNPVQKADYRNALKIAQQPLVILDKLNKNTLTPSDVKAIRSMYPALYNKMTQKLTDNMIDHMAKGNMIPYQKRLGLSMLMDKPLDSSMLPNAIVASQVVGNPNSASAQGMQQQQQQGGPKKGSAKAFEKLPSSYQTSVQAHEASNSKTPK